MHIVAILSSLSLNGQVMHKVSLDPPHLVLLAMVLDFVSVGKTARQGENGNDAMIVGLLLLVMTQNNTESPQLLVNDTCMDRPERYCSDSTGHFQQNDLAGTGTSFKGASSRVWYIADVACNSPNRRVWVSPSHKLVSCQGR